MLFNSYEFIFAFLPISVALFYVFRSRFDFKVATYWLVLCSFFFYGWWNPNYLILLLASITINFFLGNILHRNRGSGMGRMLLYLGIIANLSTIGYYKYFEFFIFNVNYVSGSSFVTENIILPLAISFFTFQQITFLVDSHLGKVGEHNFVQYCLFVSFFPQLIAGPIVHHSEMMPQFQDAAKNRLNWENISVGLIIFAFGLFKKAVLADGIAPYGSAVFAQAEQGATLDFFQAWGGALCYTFQLYFDFSGYSDMAIGAARMFGITLPLNFQSPYKATSIVDFWRRWHMTLSRFLRDYVYIALGGNRNGVSRRYLYLMLTMLIGGLWHGAGWTFIVWGGLHGFYLIVNHLWRWIRQRVQGDNASKSSWLGRKISWLVTFVAVIVGWVFFRALTFDGAIGMLEGMAGLNGVSLPSAIAYRTGSLADTLAAVGVTFNFSSGSDFVATWLWIAALFLLATAAPNTQDILRDFKPALNFKPADQWINIRWSSTGRWAVATALLLAVGTLSLPQVSEFLYFQF